MQPLLHRGRVKFCLQNWLLCRLKCGAPARLADSTSWISCFATTRWSVVTLDPGKRQVNILLLVDTTIEGASPSHARQE
jgi:hypothetical protein